MLQVMADLDNASIAKQKTVKALAEANNKVELLEVGSLACVNLPLFIRSSVIVCRAT
jgi:hypothetical protein